MRGRWEAHFIIGGLGTLSLGGYALGFPRVAGAGEQMYTRYLLLFAALFALYLLAARVALRTPTPDRLLVGLILGFGLAFRVALLPTPVVLSSDVYRYLWDGRVQRAGINPYRYPPEAPELAFLRDPVIHAAMNRPSKRTVYPPGAEALFAVVAIAAHESLTAWRLFLLACDTATVALLLGLLRGMGAPATGVLIYAWAPLVVIEAAQGHLEPALFPVLLLALRWQQAGQRVRAGLALGAAILLKLYPAVLLVAWWRRRQRRLPLACAAVVVAGYLPYGWGLGPRAFGFLPEYFGSAEDFNIGLRYFLTGWIPFGSELARETVRGVTMLVLGGVLAAVLVRIARERGDDAGAVFAAVRAAAAAYLLLIPTAMHAWYATWILPFLAVHPSAAWLWFTGAVSLSYLRYAGEAGDLPFWARAIEYLPLYALLLWGWRWGAAIGRPAGLQHRVAPDVS